MIAASKTARSGPRDREARAFGTIAGILIVITLAGIDACSGVVGVWSGAAGTNGSDTGVAPGLAFTTTAVTVTTSTSTTTSQTAVLPFTLTTAPGAGNTPPPRATSSGAGIRDVSAALVPQPSSSSGNPSYQGTLTVNFWPGSSLGAGQYSGTVRLTICTAGGTACTSQASASIAAALTVAGAERPSTTLLVHPSQLDVEGPVTSSAQIAGTLQLSLSQPSPPIYFSLAQSSSQWISAVAFQATGDQEGIVSITLLPPSQMVVGIHQGAVTLNACLDQQCAHPLQNSPLTVPATYRITPLAALSRWYQGGFAGKKLVVWGNSTVSNAVYFFQEFDSYSQANGPLAGLTPGNVLNYGNNGASLAALLAGEGPYPIDAVIAAQPDLLIMRGPLINDVRLGQTDLAQAEQLLTDALDRIAAGSPNTDILLTTENSLLTTDVGGYGWVQPNAAAQQYTDILHDAVLAMSGRYAHVAVYDIMALEYGTICQPSSPLMANQLHPNAAGQTEEADLDVEVVGLPLVPVSPQ